MARPAAIRPEPVLPECARFDVLPHRDAAAWVAEAMEAGFTGWEVVVLESTIAEFGAPPVVWLFVYAWIDAEEETAEDETCDGS